MTTRRRFTLGPSLGRALICPALLVVTLLSFALCLGAQTTRAGDPGALISMTLKGTVGVLLDEIPVGEWRETAAQEALLGHGNDEFWTERAKRQVRLTYYRLVFRGSYYPSGKGPLPLPPKSGWEVDLSGSPRRAKVDGHDFVLQDYTFHADILSDTASPAVSEPQLATIGGNWSEPFLLPVDPDLLLERTGYACMDEFEFPPDSVFELSTWYFYDQTCLVETPSTSACHVTVFPTESCQDALTNHSGLLQTTMDFTRIPWSRTLADRIRFPGIRRSRGADLAVIGDAVSQENAIYFRYFAPDACEIVEKCIAKPGWRRFLSFSANVRNDGDHDIDLGDVTDPNNPWRKANAIEYSGSHHHYHFSHYGTFQYGTLPGSKKAFCLEDTDRTHNDELTSLTPNHQSCQFQGITAGWGDEYQFGLPCQGSTLRMATRIQPIQPTQRSALLRIQINSSAKASQRSTVPGTSSSTQRLSFLRQVCRFRVSDATSHRDTRRTTLRVPTSSLETELGSLAPPVRMGRSVRCGTAVSRRSQSLCLLVSQGKP
jgi:hypothetical protein